MKTAKRYWAELIVLLATSISLSGCDSRAPRSLVVDAPPEFRDVRARALEMVEAGDIPSMSIAVAREGEIIWMEGLGSADRESGEAARPNTVYAIGSTSKSMTATLAMALAEKGLFDIDAGVDAYLAEADLAFLSIAGEFPTTRDLLTMTGGVPHGGGVTGSPEQSLSREEISRRAELVAYPPGTIYEYSNYSIGLAMRAMEGATGMRYDELMRKFVFEPLGMHDSSVSYRDDSPRQARLYDSDLEPIDYYRFYPESAGGYYSSVADLMRFALFHAGKWQPQDTVVSARNLAQMHSSIPDNVPGAFAALGMGSLDMPTAGVTQLISNGNVRGGNSHVSIFEPTGSVVVTALNMTSRSSTADAIALEISEILQPGVMEDFGTRVASFGRSNQQPFTGDPAWTGTWHGVLEGQGYEAAVELVVTDDGQMSISVGDSRPRSLDNLRFPYGTVVGRITESDNSASQPIRLSLQNSVLYGHVVTRITDGNTRGDYPRRMRLTRSDEMP